MPFFSVYLASTLPRNRETVGYHSDFGDVLKFPVMCGLRAKALRIKYLHFWCRWNPAYRLIRYKIAERKEVRFGSLKIVTKV